MKTIDIPLGQSNM